MHPLSQLDHRYVWHPFTQMRDWLKREPIVIVSARGARLRDANGREYLDGNSSIWTNLHGHRHPQITRAIERQLRKIAHSSALGLANEPASLLAEKLVDAANPRICDGRFALGQSAAPRIGQSKDVNRRLAKVFFSDDGSTAMEVALKLAYEFARRTRGLQKPKFLSLKSAYHGDTVGAVSLGHIDRFHHAYAGLLFKSDSVMAPYCYRCPFNRARPERADAREYRRCHWECVSQVEHRFATQQKRDNPYAAMVVEPRVQGAAGMIPQPAGWLDRVSQIARAHHAQLIADEVMTGFGRTGAQPVLPSDGPAIPANARANRKGTKPVRDSREAGPALFACHHEGVQPDFLTVAKGLTGGYLPMAATLTTREVFEAFLGEYEEFKTFFHGHSFTANQLGAAAALASLELLQSPASVGARAKVEETLRHELPSLWSAPNVGDIRQVGLVAGIELVKDWRTREPFDRRERAGIRVCEAMARRGVLTRPIDNVVVLMPPYCSTAAQVCQMVEALDGAVRDTLGPRKRKPG